MSEVVEPHDVAERVHPALQPAVHQASTAGNVVRTNLSAGRIALLAFGTVKYDVEVDKVQIAERGISPARAEALQGAVGTLELRLEYHETAGREVVWDNDLGVRALAVEDLGNDDLRNLDHLPRKTAEFLRVVVDVVGREFDTGAIDELGCRAAQLDRGDYQSVSDKEGEGQR